MPSQDAFSIGIGGVSLTAEQKRYIYRYWTRQRRSNRLATEASNAWHARSNELDEICALNGIYGQAKRDKRKNDWDLNDAMDKWSWHEREAKRCAAAIQTEIAATQALMGLQIPMQFKRSDLEAEDVV